MVGKINKLDETLSWGKRFTHYIFTPKQNIHKNSYKYYNSHPKTNAKIIIDS